MEYSTVGPSACQYSRDTMTLTTRPFDISFSFIMRLEHRDEVSSSESLTLKTGATYNLFVWKCWSKRNKVSDFHRKTLVAALQMIVAKLLWVDLRRKVRLNYFSFHWKRQTLFVTKYLVVTLQPSISDCTLKLFDN